MGRGKQMARLGVRGGVGRGDPRHQAKVSNLALPMYLVSSLVPTPQKTHRGPYSHKKTPAGP